MKPLQNLNKVSTHNEGNFFFFWGWMKNWNGKANFFLWSGRRNNHKAGSRRGTYTCMYTDVQNLNNALNLKSISKTEAHQLSSEYAAVLLYTSCMQRILQRCCANPSERHTALQSQLCWIAWNSFPCCPLREETKTLPQPPLSRSVVVLISNILKLTSPNEGQDGEDVIRHPYQGLLKKI